MDVNIKDLAERRVDQLRRKHRDISPDHTVQHSPFGYRAIILYAEYDFSRTGFDIIESITDLLNPKIKMTLFLPDVYQMVASPFAPSDNV